MKRHFARSGFIAAGVCVVWLALFLVWDRAATWVTSTLLEPWIVLCRLVTPSDWQSLGNRLQRMFRAGG